MRSAIDLALAGFFLLFFLSVAILWGRNDGGGHDFTGRCETCHLSFPKPGKEGKFIREISYLCRECHAVSDKNSHPIGTVPSMPMPDGFPVDRGGKMTCVTCHDPHSRLSSGDVEYLRTRARGKEFCELCHPGFLPIEGTHVGSVSIAHSKTGEHFDRSSEFERVLDKISMECLNCHDGVIASDSAYQVNGGEAFRYKRRSLSHPIGMDYRQAALRDQELRPVELLSPLIALYDGKVGCASCHNPYSRVKRMLVMSDAGSALCLQCHIK